MTDQPLSRYDYWTLRFFRDSAAITTVLVAPVYQILETRSLPVFVLISLLLLIVGHAATGFRHASSPKSIFNLILLSGSKLLKLFLLFYTLLILWMLVTLLWSPAPALGIIDISLLVIAPIFAAILAIEFSKTTIFQFSTIVLVGYCVSTGLLALELADLSQLQVYGDLDGKKHDLNRNAAQAVLVVWPVVLLYCAKQFAPLVFMVPAITSVCFVALSQSQSAQLAICAALVFCLFLKIAPKLLFLLYAMVGLVFAAFPFATQSIFNLYQSINSFATIAASAEHRLYLWRGFTEPILSNLWFGYGAKANRTMGSEGAFGRFAEEANWQGKITHPHNFSLEIWIDFGLVGISLVLAVSTVVVMMIGRLQPIYRNIAASLFFTGIVFSFSGAGFMQAWWLSAISMATAILIATMRCIECGAVSK